MSDSHQLILIVDDFLANREMLARRLEQQSYGFVMAENGVEALEKLSEHNFDLVLLDIMMPQMNGFEVLEHMRANPRWSQIPVIIISAVDDMQNVIKCIELGAEDYLTKPFNATLLKARINSSLEKKRLRELEMLRLVELNQAKDQFVSMVSHDLRNPITSIKGFAELLDDTLETEQQHDFVSRIIRGTDRMLELINDLLDLARIESGLRMNFQNVLVQDYLRERLEDFEVVAQSKDIRLHFNTNGTGVTYPLDSQRFAQVINNLLSNAIKYTPAGRDVELSLEVSENDMFIHVSDTGLGIPENDIPKLFDRFFRVNTQEHMEQKGTGLGLAIVKAITEAHRGSIQVASKLGEGTTFTIALPLVQVQT